MAEDIDYEAEARELAELAKKNRAQFALSGEIFLTNFLLGTGEYTTVEEALRIYQEQNPDKIVRFDEEHIVSDLGNIHDGMGYADFKDISPASIQRGVRGISVYVKSKIS